MKIKRLLSQILANRKNRLLYIVDASWEIFILLFPVWFILSNGKARLAETLGGNRDLASILICLTQLSMIYAEKSTKLHIAQYLVQISMHLQNLEK